MLDAPISILTLEPKPGGPCAIWKNIADSARNAGARVHWLTALERGSVPGGSLFSLPTKVEGRQRNRLV
jgi:hypothetical protein